jgi:uncharacterized membrane protein YidH (DUF202 family)
MSISSAAKDRRLLAFVLTFLALVLFAVGLVNRLEPQPHESPTVGVLDDDAAGVPLANRQLKLSQTVA